MLRHKYFPDRSLNRMRNSSDVVGAHRSFFEKKPLNLIHLLNYRYGWMNSYLQSCERVIEFGSGAGLCREFIDHPGLYLTDVEVQPWISIVTDAVNPPFKRSSVDAVICSEVVHHLAYPRRFFDAMSHILKPSGLLLLQEAEASLLHRLVMRTMRHEGWSYEVDVFDHNAICNDPHDPWSGNNAVPQMLFSDPEQFEKKVPDFRILLNEKCECLLFLNSGGVTAKTFSIPLPLWGLKLISKIDDLLVDVAPSLFPLGRRIALQKV